MNASHWRMLQSFICMKKKNIATYQIESTDQGWSSAAFLRQQQMKVPPEAQGLYHQREFCLFVLPQLWPQLLCGEDSCPAHTSLNPLNDWPKQTGQMWRPQSHVAQVYCVLHLPSWRCTNEEHSNGSTARTSLLNMAPGFDNLHQWLTPVFLCKRWARQESLSSLVTNSALSLILCYAFNSWLSWRISVIKNEGLLLMSTTQRIFNFYTTLTGAPLPHLIAWVCFMFIYSACNQSN